MLISGATHPFRTGRKKTHGVVDRVGGSCWGGTTIRGQPCFVEKEKRRGRGTEKKEVGGGEYAKGKVENGRYEKGTIARKEDRGGKYNLPFAVAPQPSSGMRDWLRGRGERETHFRTRVLIWVEKRARDRSAQRAKNPWLFFFCFF